MENRLIGPSQRLFDDTFETTSPPSQSLCCRRKSAGKDLCKEGRKTPIARDPLLHNLRHRKLPQAEKIPPAAVCFTKTSRRAGARRANDQIKLTK